LPSQQTVNNHQVIFIDLFQLASLSHIPLARPSSREKLVSMRNSPVAQSSYQNHSVAAHETGLHTAPSSNQYVA